MNFSKLFRAAAALALAVGLVGPAMAQSSPGWSYGYVPTPGEWNNAFALKQDLLGYIPLNVNGGTMLGRLGLAAGTTGAPSINCPTGVAPTSPTDGDIWCTSAGIFIQTNGVTVGPLASTTGPFLGAITPVQSLTATSKTYGLSDFFNEWRRSNTGSAMSDTFPAAGTTGLVNGSTIDIFNVDATASITIAAGSGNTFSGSSGVITPNRYIRYVYDLPNTQWRPQLNTFSALLTSNNLSDVTSAAAAAHNLGLGTADSPTFAGTALTGLNVAGNVCNSAGGVLSTSTSPCSGVVAVASVFGRTGAVVAATNDYSTNQIATSNGTAAAGAGKIGEVLTSVQLPTGGTGVALSTGVVANSNATVTLTPGSWNCEGSVAFFVKATTTFNSYAASINTAASVALNNGFLDDTIATKTGALTLQYALAAEPFTVSTNTAVVVNGSAVFATSGVNLGGWLTCTRTF